MNRRKFLIKSTLAAAGFSFLPGRAESRPIIQPTHLPKPSEWPDNKITMAWIGHSTVLINFYGIWVLTDPVLFERIGLYIFGFTWGPSRYSMPALNFESIPRPDIVLLSHAHFDHTDYLSLKELTEKYPKEIDMVTSFNTKDVASDLQWKSFQELDWGESLILNGLEISALEVKHFGWRVPWEKDRSRGFMKDGRSYNAYLLKRKAKHILFGGDTALTEKLHTDDKLNIEAAIMPIGAYFPWRMNHCTPEESLSMAERFRARFFLPIHFNTFQQGREPRKEPMERLLAAAEKSTVQIGWKEIGETFSTAVI